MRIQLTLLVLLYSAICAPPGRAQSPDGGLPRRPWLGVALGTDERGVSVTGVVEDSSAADAGIRAGDVIRAVDGAAVRVPPDVTGAFGRHAAGDTVSLEIIRAGEVQQLMVRLRSFPRESLAGTSFEYGAVTAGDGIRLRTIVSVPDRAGARLPAVMLIQGGGCNSIEVPMAAGAGHSDVLRAIGAQGYVTLRVDKSGVGDSQGPPCDAIGYLQELDGYRAALDALKRHPSVNADRVFLLGLSLGGLFAPVLAGERTVRGIVAYGTLAAPPSPYAGRSERFFREIAALDVAAAWSAVPSRVLVLHGQFDEVTNEADHARIAALVNARHPGAATHLELTGLDHCWTRHETIAASRGKCGQGQAVPAFADAVLTFLRGAG